MFGGHECTGTKSVLVAGYTYAVCPDCDKNPKIISYYETPESINIMKGFWSKSIMEMVEENNRKDELK